jgi:hypothetical protein
MNLTKQEAIENHRKMWKWIAGETLIRKYKVLKEEYFREHNIPVYEIPLNECYCCEHAKLIKQPWISQCEYCPIVWIKNISFYKCLYVNSPYYLWADTRDYVRASKLARQIAELPEKEGSEYD